MATPQKPIPAPIDRFNEKMAMDARACHQISHFVLCFKFCFSCLPPEAGTPLVYHGWICLKELIVHPWQLDIRYWDMIDTQLKKMPVCLCYRVISKQIDTVIFPMLCDGKYITMCTHCYYELWNWLASLSISLDLLFSLLIWQIRNPCRY